MHPYCFSLKPVLFLLSLFCLVPPPRPRAKQSVQLITYSSRQDWIRMGLECVLALYLLYFSITELMDVVELHEYQPPPHLLLSFFSCLLLSSISPLPPPPPLFASLFSDFQVVCF